MAKIRHIAIRVEDVEATASFFQQALGLELIQRRAHGPIDLSNGDVNITLLPARMGAPGTEVRLGFDHIGFTVADQDEARKDLIESGATELNPISLGDAYYESKYRSPQGLVVDVGHWRGTTPIPALGEKVAAV